MRLLFAISAAGFCAIFGLALLLVRRSRRRHKASEKPATHPPAMEIFEAGEFRTPRALRLTQEIAQQGLRRNLLDYAPAPNPLPREPHRAQVAPIRELQSSPLMPQVPAANLFPIDEVPHQTKGQVPRETPLETHLEAVIVGSKLQFVSAERPQQVEAPLFETPPRDISGERKPPQPARSGTFRRVDLSNYNRDLGDLTDPYTNSARGSGNPPDMAKNA